MIWGYKLQQNVWKYKSAILICALKMVFITKPATIDLFIFIEKLRKKTLCLTRKYQASLQKNNSWFWWKGELKQLYELYCANENIRDNKKTKYFLQENFKEPLYHIPIYWIQGNPIAVHAHEINPVDHAIASIIGARLHDEEITISFAKMIHRKVKAQETWTTFPLSAENLSAVMKTQFTYFFN